MVRCCSCFRLIVLCVVVVCQRFVCWVHQSLNKGDGVRIIYHTFLAIPLWIQSLLCVITATIMTLSVAATSFLCVPSSHSIYAVPVSRFNNCAYNNSIKRFILYWDRFSAWMLSSTVLALPFRSYLFKLKCWQTAVGQHEKQRRWHTKNERQREENRTEKHQYQRQHVAVRTRKITMGKRQ